MGIWRFVFFAAACAAWLGAMLIWSDSWTIFAAGEAWFINWTIQIFVTLIAWTIPFSLPDRYYQPLVDHQPSPWLARVTGIKLYKRVVLWINPFTADSGSPEHLDAAIDAAETTHAVTFVILSAIALLLAAWGAIAVAMFLTAWNILLNLYSIALQRHTRARLRRVAMRRAGRRSTLAGRG